MDDEGIPSRRASRDNSLNLEWVETDQYSVYLDVRLIHQSIFFWAH